MFTMELNKTIKSVSVAVFVLSLTACSGLFDKDNTPEPKPLTQFTAEIKPQLLWSARAGTGAGDERLKFSPAIGTNAIYTSSSNGTVTSTNKQNGLINWQVNTDLPISTGPGIGDGIVVVGSRRGDVIALQQSTGKTLWKTGIPGEIIANPAISHGNVIIKAVDGFIRALSTTHGHESWSFQQVEPNLILRGSSTPLIRDNDIIVGFANGNLAKINLQNGQLYWMQTIAVPEGAFAIQRMIDIDADPVVYGHRIFAATYQGKIASLEWNTGRTIWSHDISSYTGMIADESSTYISDAKGHVWSFGVDSGTTKWTQTALEARKISGPALMGNYLIVGDGEGYLHWLSKRDGHIAAREFAGAAIFADPVVENNVLYALTNNGYLVAYRLNT